MNYTTIEFNSWDEWHDAGVPSEGAYHFVIKNKTGTRQEVYFLNGRRYRDGGLPVEILYNKEGLAIRKYWNASWHDVVLYEDGKIGIGCEKHIASYWLENWKTIAEKYNISESEIQNYKKAFDLIQSQAQ